MMRISGASDEEGLIPPQSRSSTGRVAAPESRRLLTSLFGYPKPFAARPRACCAGTSFTRPRHYNGNGHRRHSHRSRPVQLRQAVRSMVGPDTPTAFHRRQDEAWRHLEAGRPIPAPVARCRGHCRDAPHQRQANAYGKLDQEAQREEAFPPRLRRARQQAGPDRMGSSDPEGGLSPLRTFDLSEPRSPELVMAVDDE